MVIVHCQFSLCIHIRCISVHFGAASARCLNVGDSIIQSKPLLLFCAQKRSKKRLGCRNVAKFSASLPGAFKLAALKQKMRLSGTETENASRQISKAEKRKQRNC